MVLRKQLKFEVFSCVVYMRKQLLVELWYVYITH